MDGVISDYRRARLVRLWFLQSTVNATGNERNVFAWRRIVGARIVVPGRKANEEVTNQES